MFLFFKKSKLDSRYCRNYQDIRNEIVQDIRPAKLNYFPSLCQSSSFTSSTWKLIKSLSKSPASVPDIEIDGKLITDDIDKANALNSHFIRCFNTSVPPLSTMSSNPTSHSLEEMVCQPDIVAKIITSWNSKPSCGPDGIPITLLKLAPTSIAVALTPLFKKSLTLCAIPQECKLANITPIPKSVNKRNKVEAYRPISLLLVPSKILEKLILTIMTDHIELNNLLSDN